MSVACGAFCFIKKSGLQRIFCIENLLLNHSVVYLISNFSFCLLIYWWCTWFELQYSVITRIQFVPNSNEERDAGQPITRRLFLYQLFKSTIAGPPSNLKSRPHPDQSVNNDAISPANLKVHDPCWGLHLVLYPDRIKKKKSSSKN